MKKVLCALLIGMVTVNSFSGQIGLPEERIALPAVQGDYLICIWDETTGAWLGEFEAYDHTGSYGFQLPAWEEWYWIGLWDVARQEYVFEKWIGHFITD